MMIFTEKRWKLWSVKEEWNVYFSHFSYWATVYILSWCVLRSPSAWQGNEGMTVSCWGVVWWGSGSWFGRPVALGELETISLTACFPPLALTHRHTDTQQILTLQLDTSVSCRANLRYEVEPGRWAWLYRWCNKLVSLLFEVTYRGNACHTTRCWIGDVLQCKLSHKVWERGKHPYPFIHLIKLVLESYSSSRAKGRQHASFFSTKEDLIKRLSCVCLPKRPQKHLK